MSGLAVKRIASSDSETEQVLRMSGTLKPRPFGLILSFKWTLVSVKQQL